MSFSVVISLALLIFFLIGSAHSVFRGHPFCGALIALGSLGFLGSFALPAAGDWLRHVELPQLSFGTTSIAGLDGRIFAATGSLSRIQSYDDNGHFEIGWFVDNQGGVFAIGLTTSGQIAVAAQRTKKIEFFNTDGSLAGPPQPFTWSDGPVTGLLRPANIQVEGVSFAEPIQVSHPKQPWLALILFPLWNPFVPWFLVALGVVCIRRKRRSIRRAK